MVYPRVSSFKTVGQLRDRFQELGISLDVDETIDPERSFGQACKHSRGAIGNRFCILPMEGWDGTTDGHPTDLTRRRWKHFGISGAKLIWGGEAVAVRPEGRANPHQLLISERTIGDLAGLRELLVKEHIVRFGTADDLLIGLQLTHSGRFARPWEGREGVPRIAYRHPLLDPRTGVTGDGAILDDSELERLADDFVSAAVLAQRAGFVFVDIKHCHGYLGHELLSAETRPGRFGGSLENRTRFLRDVIGGIRSEAPGLEVGVRVSVFDFVPFEKGADGVGVPSGSGSYSCAFGGDGTGTGIDLTEPRALLTLLADLEVELVCTTAGSPYYNPHIQRPAFFPPSDGYLPPEDPLVGVARQIEITGQLKREFPGLTIVGSGYSYLQEWLPHVAQPVLRQGLADFIGLGRMVLSYPEFPADVLSGRPLARKRICRTFSDCTTAPRNHLVSGCYPLDPFYKSLPEHEQLAALKAGNAEPS